MRLFAITAAVLFCVLLVCACATPGGNTRQEKIEYITAMKNETLATLFRSKPEARTKIRRAAGYAVFSNINTNLFLLSSGNGYGVAIDNSSGRRTYMKMNFLGIGPGIGIKDFRAVFVFNNKDVLDDFIESGWEFGVHADAAAKSGEKGAAAGGEIYVERAIEIYQITDAGIALQATIAGTKYRKYSELN